MTTLHGQAALRQIGIVTGMLLVVAALYLARELLIPLALSLFITFILWPVTSRLQRCGFGRVGSALTSLAGGIIILALLGWLVAAQAADVVADMPRYQENIFTKLRALERSLPFGLDAASEALKRLDEAAVESPGESPLEAPDAGATTKPQPAPGIETPPPSHQDAESMPVPVRIVPGPRELFAIFSGVLRPVVDPLATFGIAVVCAAFFLIHREDLRDRVVYLSERARISLSATALADIGARVTRYLGAQATANAVIGTAIGLGFLVIGVPKPMLWGFLAGILRFIPYVGSTVAAGIPAMLSFAIFEGWLRPLAVIGWTVLVDATSANAIEPRLYGSRTGVSPTAVLLSLIFWTWLWGGIGLILATPITVSLVALGKHIPAFEVFYVTLGEAPMLQPQLRFYQRLLACDWREAQQVVLGQAGTGPLTELYDRIVLPALAQLEQDYRAGVMDERRAAAAQRTVAELMRLLHEQHGVAERPPEPSLTAPPVAATVLFVEDRGRFDALVVEMLRQTAGLEDAASLRRVADAELFGLMLRGLQETPPAAIVLSALEPRQADRALHLCKRLVMGEAPASVLVGLFVRPHRGRWAFPKPAGRTRVRICPTMTELVEGVRDALASDVPDAVPADATPGSQGGAGAPNHRGSRGAHSQPSR